jgi:hypothetical protein
MTLALARLNLTAAILINLLLTSTVNAQQPSVEWIRKYGSSAITSPEIGNMVVIDDSGNVYVTGTYFSASAGFSNFGTIKYNSSGVVQWDTTYNGASTGSSDDEGLFIAVDDSGNVYVCGHSQQTTAACYDYCTIKYNPAGIPMWINRYDRTGVDEDRPGEMKIDNKGNIYVTGYTYNSPTVYDYTTIKYNAGGAVQWIRHYDGQAGQDDYAYTLDIDDSGNVYVSGSEYFNGSGDFYITTIKYDSLGFTKWVRNFYGCNDYARPYDMAADDSGNVYVVGYYGCPNLVFKTVIIKYNSVGDSVWVNRDDSLITSPTDTKILIDKSGDLLVIGRGDSGYVTVKYSPSGGIKWTAYFYDDAAIPSSLDTDKDGSVYVTGQSSGAFPNPDRDYWTVKYDSSGTEKWRVSYSAAPINSSDCAKSITVDTMGNVFVTGLSAESGSNSQYGTIKYAQNVGVNEQTAVEGLTLYPNPFSTKLTIMTRQEMRSACLELFNIMGEKVYECKGFTGNRFILERNGISAGLYFVRISEGDRIFSEKVIIE